MEIFCALGIFLLVVTVLGHGMWVAVAWFFRAMAESPTHSARPCPQCGRYGLQNGRCVICGAVPHVPPARQPLRDELRLTIAHLRRLAQRGMLEQAECERIVAFFEAELRELTPGATPSAPPVPIEPPLAESKLLPERRETAPPVARPVPIYAPIAAAGPVQAAPGPALVPAVRPVEVVSAALVHPLDRPVAPVPPTPPRQPGRSLADMLQSFMEESNIRWGEILAAMLIVLCSVGLVISLRAKLQEIPYFPAILFTLFTVSFHGSGLYTLRRWKLQAVSRVILIISLLLVPLTFCGAIALQQSRPTSWPLLLIAVAAGTAIFTWVAYTASRAVLGRAAWPLAIGVVGPSLAQVLVQHVDYLGGDVWRLNLVFSLPLACFLFAAWAHYGDAARRKRLAKPRIVELLHVLGIAGFALLVLVAVLLVRVGPRLAMVARLSPEFCIAAAAALAVGLLIQGRATARRLAAWQTAGTAIVVLAAMLMLALVAATWPEPELLLAVGIINGLVLLGLGRLAQMPLLYVPGVACAAIATVVGMHLVGGQFAERDRLALKLIEASLMGRTGLALAMLGSVVAISGRFQAVRNQTDDARMLLASAGGLAAIVLAITVFSGFITVPGWQQDRDLAAGTLLALAVGLIAAGPFVRRAEVAGAGSFVTWLALVQALVLNSTIRSWLDAAGWLPDRPLLLATLAHGVLTAFVAMLATGRQLMAMKDDFAASQALPWRQYQYLTEPLASGAAVSLVVVVPFIVWVRGGDFGGGTALALAATVGWALLAAGARWPGAISGVQAMSALAAALYIAGIWSPADASATSLNDWMFGFSHLSAQAIAVAASAMIWSAARRMTSGKTVLHDLLNAEWVAVDQLLLGITTVALPALSFLLVAPHVGWELGLMKIESDGLLPIAGGTLGRGWLAVAAIVAALMVSLWERVRLEALIGLGIATFACVWIGAGHFESSTSIASAARWAGGLYAVVWAAAYLARGPIALGAKRLLRWDGKVSDTAAWFCAQPLVFGGTTVLVLTVFAVQQHTAGAVVQLPVAGSVFARMGLMVSYATPLAMLVGVLLAYAVRERQAGFALGGAVIWQLGANLAYSRHADLSLAEAVRIIGWLQWNSVAAAAYALVWLGLARWITPATKSDSQRRISDGFWLVPVATSAVTALALVGWAAVAIIDNPGSPPAEVESLGGVLSYLAVGLLLIAAVWRAGGRFDFPYLGDAIAWLAAGVVPLAAATVQQFDAGGQWLAFHTLEAGWLAVSILACGAVCISGRRTRPYHLSVAAIAALVVYLAMHANRRDPGQPWWSFAGVSGACAIAVALGQLRRSQAYAYASTALASLVVALFWIAPATDPYITAVFDRDPYSWLAGFELIVLAAVGMAGFWLSREIAYQQQEHQAFDPQTYLPTVQATTAIFAVPVYFLGRLFLAMFDHGSLALAYDGLAIVVVLAIGALLLASMWDRRAVYLWPVAYLWLAAVWCLLISLAREYIESPEQTAIALLLAAAAQVAVTGQLWSYGANLAAWGAKHGISDPIGGLARTEKWLPTLNICLTTAIAIVSLGPVLAFAELPLRVLSAWGPAIAAWGLVCLAQHRRRESLQLASLLLAGLTAIYLAWAQVTPGDSAAWMTRVFRLFMVLGAMTFAYGLILPRLLWQSGSWNATTRRAGYVAGAAALAAFAGTLALELQLYMAGRQTEIADVQVAAIAVLLLGLIAGLVSLAVLPGSDPLVLSERGRQGYVYAAEACAALAFAHIYVCRPEWFGGVLAQYWPFIVMAIAFAGLGAAEILERRGVRVIAEPLMRTGAMLPLLPVLGWWVAGYEASYSLVLLITGMLYLGLSYTRRSWAAMIAATMAGNGALWALLSDTDLAFAMNPQLWLIPPAISVLVAAQLNRRRLAPEALAAVRYAATAVIYVSSTSEIVTRGFAAGLFPPMILLGLAVAGALAGIALQVRAFLLLGTSFTLVALIAMVRHAAQSIGHVWPWWVFGIALGVAILVLFGVFEKKRSEVTLLIARLRQWER